VSGRPPIVPRHVATMFSDAIATNSTQRGADALSLLLRDVFGFDASVLSAHRSVADAVRAVSDLRSAVTAKDAADAADEIVRLLVSEHGHTSEVAERSLKGYEDALWGPCVTKATCTDDFASTITTAALDLQKAMPWSVTRDMNEIVACGRWSGTPQRPQDIAEPEMWHPDAPGGQSAIDGVTPMDVNCHRRVSFMYRKMSPWSGRFGVFGMSTVDKAHAHRRLKWCRFVFAVSIAHPFGQHMQLTTSHIGWDAGRWWTGSQFKDVRAVVPSNGPGRYMVSKAERLLGLLFARRYNWMAKLSIGGAVDAIQIPTDASGARELFATRDKAPGDSRRTALLHWVRAHHRRSRVAVDSHDVAKHLRGATSFSWNGLGVELVPSEYDREVVMGSRA
jgi:hypothetical protein